jgi:hypothetical protein
VQKTNAEGRRKIGISNKRIKNYEKVMTVTRGNNGRRSSPTTGIPLSPERHLDLGRKKTTDSIFKIEREQALLEMNGNCS